MKKKQRTLASIIILIILTFFVGPGRIQAWDGDYLIMNSAHIAALSGHTEVTGDLIIYNTGPLTNLGGLESLTSVGGNLSIVFNNTLTNLTGLNNIISVGGGLVINYNNALASLDGLNNLTSVVENLAIHGNDTLTSLTGINNLTSCKHLVIGYNDALTSLDGLEGLTTINGLLTIYKNYTLTSLSALSNLISVGDIYIGENDALTSLDGLEGLTTVSGLLSIYRNYTLTSLSALSNLISVGDIYIGENDALTSLDGLNNLTSVVENLAIADDDLLTSLSALSNLSSVGGILTIGFNDALTSLDGLNNLTSVGGGLGIGYNDALTSLTGLEGLTSVNGNLVITDDDLLTSLSGLNNITSVNGNLYIGFNDALTSLDGLNNLTSVEGLLAIVYNDSLTNLCDLYNANVAGDKSFIFENILLSMDTAYALENQLRYNGFTGAADIYGNNGTGLANCGQMGLSIDIKPGSDPNCFNHNDQGVIPVAIFGSPDFDVNNVNPDSLALQGLSVKTVGKSNKYLAHYEQVNADDFLDLVVQFEDSDGWVDTENGLALLTGELYDGTPIEGTDSICTVPVEPSSDIFPEEPSPDICLEDPMRDHVFEIEIETGYIDPNPAYWFDKRFREYKFDISLYTDSSVKKVAFLSASGNLFEFEAVDEVEEEVDDGWIVYGREDGDEAGVDELFYRGKFNNSAACYGAFGAGYYIVTVYYDNGCSDQTTAWFGIPGTNNPINHPSQVPVITNFSNGDTISSPVIFEWLPYEGSNANLIRFGWENDYEENDRFLSIDTTALPEPLALDVGLWTIGLAFEVWYNTLNSDGIQISAGYYSQTNYEFTVE